MIKLFFLFNQFQMFNTLQQVIHRSICIPMAWQQIVTPLLNTVELPVLWWAINTMFIYCQIYNISRALVGIKIVCHSDVVAALPAASAPATSSFST